MAKGKAEWVKVRMDSGQGRLEKAHAIMRGLSLPKKHRRDLNRGMT